ncbi:MAG: DUF502 domain-containing protein [Chthoniobacterales bacterium]|nr:DUF502 domain-containing protein [Chthoniobacterales bacterium]
MNDPLSSQPSEPNPDINVSIKEITSASLKTEKTSLLRHLGNRLFAGVAVAVPLIATVLVLEVAYNFINGVSAPLYRALKITIPGIGFVTTILLLMLLGFMATHVVGSRILHAFESFLNRIPLVAQIHSVVKQALESFKTIKAAENFKRVAYVECPSTGCILVGYVTGQIFEPKLGGMMTMVFVPHSPNPLTGFLIIVENHKVIESTLTLEQVTKLIMSAGLVAPVYSKPEESGSSSLKG